MDEVARGKITWLAHIRRGGSCMRAPAFGIGSGTAHEAATRERNVAAAAVTSS